jgi:hypothetical protein
MNWKRPKIIALIVATAMLLLACVIVGWLIYWNFDGRYRAFEYSLPIYTGVERVASDFIYNDTQSGFTAIYFWSIDSVEEVQDYFQNLAQQSAETNLRVILHKQLNDSDATCYSWFNGPTEYPNCFEVTLMDFSGLSSIDLPNIMLVRGIAPYYPTPQPRPLENRKGGTLIVYGYYTPEM